MKSINKVFLSLLLIISSFFLTKNVEATEGDSVGYSVQAVLPDAQRDTGATYFDLLVEPKKSYELQVQIYNHEDKELTVNVSPTTATTNQNALIVYDEQENFDDSLAYPISELVMIEEPTVKVPANETATVDLKLTMPDKDLERFLLGGILIRKEIEESDSQEGVQINNEYAYVIGLQVTEDEQVVEPNLNLKGIYPKLVNYRTAVVAELQNDQPVIIGDVDIEAEVYKENKPDEVFKTASIEGGQFAPNSTMEFVIDWENQYLEPGDYRLKMTAADGNQEWEWDEPFTITDEEGQISEDAVELEENTWLTPQLFIGVVVVLLIIIVVLLYKNRNKS